MSATVMTTAMATPAAATAAAEQEQKQRQRPAFWRPAVFLPERENSFPAKKSPDILVQKTKGSYNLLVLFFM